MSIGLAVRVKVLDQGSKPSDFKFYINYIILKKIIIINLVVLLFLNFEKKEKEKSSNSCSEILQARPSSPKPGTATARVLICFSPKNSHFISNVVMNSTTLSSPLQNFSLFHFPLHRCAKPSTKTTRFSRNSSFSLKSFSPLRPPPSAAALRVVRCCAADDDKVDKSRPRIQRNNLRSCNGGNNALDVAKPIACALLYVFIGIFCPFVGFRKPALAAAVAAAAPSAAVQREKSEENGHKYSQYTRRLLGAVSQLLKIIEEARNEGKEDSTVAVEKGLKEFKRTKADLQDELMSGFYSELRVLKEEKEALIDRSEEIVNKSFKARREEENLMKKAKGGGDKLQRLREEKRSWEREYNDLWERIREVEDLIERNETIAFSIGVRELLAIERECEALVKNFLSEMRSRDTQR